MSGEITPERADKVLDRAVDVTQLVSILGGVLALLAGLQAVLDEDWVGGSTGIGAAILAALAFTVASWARAWMLRR